MNRENEKGSKWRKKGECGGKMKNGKAKTVAIFFAVYTVRSTRTVFFLADLLETFSKDCVKELKRR